jgi:hypothetical protein
MALSCTARWCTPCPYHWREGAQCRESDSILDRAEAYRQEAQDALDAYDLAHPEDFFQGDG